MHSARSWSNRDALATALVVGLVLVAACSGPTTNPPGSEKTVATVVAPSGEATEVAATPTSEAYAVAPSPTSEDTAMPTPTPTPGATPIPPLTEEALTNATYRGITDEPIRLTDGQYEGEPLSEDDASRPTVLFTGAMAAGDLDGDGVADTAVVLAENSGANGTLIYLAAVLNRNGRPDNVATQLLGDQTQVQTMVIDGGEITVTVMAHGPDDPTCCPSQLETRVYALDGGELVLLRSAVTDPESDITSREWRWVRFEGGDGAQIVVEEPARYTLTLNPDGTYHATADCNQAGGDYVLEGSNLTLKPGPTTLAECEPGSLYDVYLARLGDVVAYLLDGDWLYLNLWADAGTMAFAREGVAASGAVPEPASVTVDAPGLADAYRVDLVPASAYDAGQEPGPVGLPAHVQITFGVTDPAVVQPGDPILTIIPATAYRQMWEANGNLSVTGELERLRALLTERPAPISGVPILPFERATGVNDLSARAAYLDLDWGSGIRMVGRFVAGPNPVTREGLFYIFQGLSSDGQYLVSFFYPISTEVLPPTDEVSAEELQRVDQDLAGYLSERVAQLDALTDSDWSPALDRLDALVASLEYGGKPGRGE